MDFEQITNKFAKILRICLLCSPLPFYYFAFYSLSNGMAKYFFLPVGNTPWM